MSFHSNATTVVSVDQPNFFTFSTKALFDRWVHQLSINRRWVVSLTASWRKKYRSSINWTLYCFIPSSLYWSFSLSENMKLTFCHNAIAEFLREENFESCAEKICYSVSVSTSEIKQSIKRALVRFLWFNFLQNTVIWLWAVAKNTKFFHL